MASTMNDLSIAAQVVITFLVFFWWEMPDVDVPNLFGKVMLGCLLFNFKKYMDERTYARDLFDYCSKWYSVEDDAQRVKFRSLLKTGYIVEVKTNSWRGTEWGICVQEDEERGILFVSPFRKVSLSDISNEVEDWVRGSLQIRINNSMDNIYHPKKVNDILTFVQEAVAGKPWAIAGIYDKWTNDSKHFVTRARYPLEAVVFRLDEHHRSPWFREKDLETFRWMVRPLDLIEFDRFFYSHWAVCDVRDANRLHHRSGINVSNKGPILSTPIEEIIKKGRFRINNGLDSEHKPRSFETVIHRMSIFILDDSKAYGCYNLIMNNCQRYAEFIRYGLHFRENLGLVKFVFSTEDLIVTLSEGDIFGFAKSDTGDNDEELQTSGFAIYIGKELDADGPIQVSYGCKHACLDAGASSARAEPMDDFLERVEEKKHFIIFNHRDNWNPPLKLKTTVEAIKKAIRQEDTCGCCPFENSSLDFVQEVRNGTEAERMKAASRSATLWTNMLNPLSIWHMLVCRDCSTH